MNDSTNHDYHLEIKILNRILIISCLVVFVYLGYDYFFKGLTFNLIPSTIILSLYTTCLLLVNYATNKGFYINLTMALIMASIFASYIQLGGFKGVTVLDICNLFIVITIIFSGNTRKIFLGVYLFIFLCLVLIEFKMPEIIMNIRKDDDLWFDILEMITRCVTAFNIGFAVKTEYDKENRNISVMNRELKKANNEVITQNEAILQQREEIGLINERLEDLVDERTKKIESLNEKIVEYAFFNAHKVRAPLARIMGLVYIAKIDGVYENQNLTVKSDYFEALELNAKELDTVVKEINSLLTEKEKILQGEKWIFDKG